MPKLIEMCNEKMLYNINIPKTKEIKGIEVTRQALSFFMDQYEKRTDPRNRSYYWLKSVSYSQEPSQNIIPDFRNDLESINDGYISITPLQFDLTSYETMKRLKNKY